MENAADRLARLVRNLVPSGARLNLPPEDGSAAELLAQAAGGSLGMTAEQDRKVQVAHGLIAAELARKGSACVTSSFQTECVVLVHMIVEQRPDIPVLFLETGYHFPETLAYRDQIAAEWKLNLKNLEAKQSVADQEVAVRNFESDRA